MPVAALPSIEYQTIRVSALERRLCGRLHFVNPKTGETVGGDDK